MEESSREFMVSGLWNIVKGVYRTHQLVVDWLMDQLVVVVGRKVTVVLYFLEKSSVVWSGVMRTDFAI